MADASSHARHDRFAIAAAVGGAMIPPTVTTCRQCGALHTDLLSIKAALRHAWTPRRPRDLRLRSIDVAGLRPALWSRLLAVIGSSRDAITRPLAVGLTSVGIAGVVLSGTTFAFGGAAAGAVPTDVTIEAAGAPASGPVDQKIVAADDLTDPLLTISVGSLAAGSGVFVLRRIARRLRGVR